MPAPASPWLKLYRSTLKSLAEHGVSDTAKLIWYELLQVCDEETGEVKPISVLSRFHLFRESAQVEKGIAELTAIECIEERDGKRFLSNWHRYQRKTSTDRMRALRERKRNGAIAPTCQEIENITARPIELKPPVRVKTGDHPLTEAVRRGCEQFMARYPNKVKTDLAVQAWISLVCQGEITDANVHEVLEGLQRWMDSRQWSEDGGKYIPDPATFLIGNARHTGRLWKDHPIPSDETKARKRSQQSGDGSDPYAVYVPRKRKPQSEVA